jgi:hypothetical protein
LRTLIDKALKRGYVLLPLRGTSPPPGRAGLLQALARASSLGPLPTAVEATTGSPMSSLGAALAYGQGGGWCVDAGSFARRQRSGRFVMLGGVTDATEIRSQQQLSSVA